MLKKIFLNFISFLFHFIPRNNHLWVTGKIASWEYNNTPPAFFDNSKYFFLYLVNNTSEKVYWLSASEKEIKMLKEMNLPVVRYPSVKGIWLVLRAKYSFHHYGPDQIDRILQRGSIQLDFWHGTPLKKIRYDIVDKPVEKHNFYLDLMNKDSKEYVFSTSQYLSKTVLAGAFKIKQDDLLNFGYPRMDVMGLSKDDTYEFCKKYSPELLKFIDVAKSYSKTFLYMPTFRDDDPNYFEKASIDFELLNENLVGIDAVFFLKLHPLTKYSTLKKYTNIVQISNDVDIYPFLIFTDYLITDYSSIYFDYLPLNKEIIFIPYDYDNYVRHRELYFEYDNVTPGKKYTSFCEFVLDIKNIDQLNYSKERDQVRNLMIEDYHFDACKKTYEFIKENYQY